MNRTNHAPGGYASQAKRTPEQRTAIAKAGYRAWMSLRGRKGGIVSNARKTAEERSADARRAALARWAK